MTPPWWAAVAPASADVPCSGGTHVVAWEQGRLRLRDHDDLEAERALRALGGDVPGCLALKHAWDRHVDDPSIITLGRRPSEATVGFDRVHPGTGDARRRDLLLLFALPPPLIDRLVLSAIAAATDAWPEPEFRRLHGLRIGAALSARATPALRRFAGDLVGPEESLVVHCTPAGSGVPLTVLAERTDDGMEVSASVPLTWLRGVWGGGLSEPEGRFVLAVTEQLDDVGACFAVELATWAPSGSEHWEARPVPAEVRRDGDGAWRVGEG